jgi:hypothetical protein
LEGGVVVVARPRKHNVAIIAVRTLNTDIRLETNDVPTDQLDYENTRHFLASQSLCYIVMVLRVIIVDHLVAKVSRSLYVGSIKIT